MDLKNNFGYNIVNNENKDINEIKNKIKMLPIEKKTLVLDNKSPSGKVEDLYHLSYEVFEDDLFYQTLLTARAPKNLTVRITYDDTVEITEEFVLVASGVYGSNPNMQEYSGRFISTENSKGITITTAPFYESDAGEVNKTVISFEAYNITTEELITDTIKKATITLDIVEKQFDDKYLASMNYDKLFNIPYDIDNLNRGFSHVLESYQMLGLYENIFTLKDCLSSFLLVNKYPDNVTAPTGRDNTVASSMNGDITMYAQSKHSEGGKGIHFVVPASTSYFMQFHPDEDIVYELVKKTGDSYEKKLINNFTGSDIYIELVNNPVTDKPMDVWAIFSYKDEYIDPGKGVQNLTVYDATKFLSKRDVPTKTSQLINDSQFISGQQVDNLIYGNKDKGILSSSIYLPTDLPAIPSDITNYIIIKHSDNSYALYSVLADYLIGDELVIMNDKTFGKVLKLKVTGSPFDKYVVSNGSWSRLKNYYHFVMDDVVDVITNNFVVKDVTTTPTTVYDIKYVNKRIEEQQIRGTTSEVSAYIGKEGQLVVDKELKQLHIMDGTTPGGTIIDNYKLSFNANGELEVTIGGVTKTFIPKS